jgi:hypothetical protein
VPARQVAPRQSAATARSPAECLRRVSGNALELCSQRLVRVPQVKGLLHPEPERRPLPVHLPSRTAISGVTDAIGIALMAAAILLCAILFLVLAIPTLVHLSLGGFRSRELFTSTSPAARYRIDGLVSVDFPANEILDPSGTIRITLWDSRTGEAVDQLFVGLYEADDFAKPTIIWGADGRVEVRNMERAGHNLSATLNVHGWDPK